MNQFLKLKVKPDTNEQDVKVYCTDNTCSKHDICLYADGEGIVTPCTRLNIDIYGVITVVCTSDKDLQEDYTHCPFYTDAMKAIKNGNTEPHLEDK